LATLKRRRVITSSDCNSKAFTAVNFAKSNDKNNQFLVTISGTPDFSVIIWLWDKQRCVARHRYCQDEIEQIPLHASFDPADPTMLLVTGNNLYNFFKINETNLQTLRGSLMKKDKGRFSTDYTCHIWINKKIIVCTHEGEILLCEHNGDFKMCLPQSPGPEFNI